MGTHFDLERALGHGLLPAICFSDDPQADLAAYTGVYLQEEIAAEGVSRNVAAFSRFLQVAALCNATIVNFTNVASDTQVPRTTVYECFEILRDTLVLHELPAWKRSKKRNPIAASKYYFFDVGVVGALQGRTFRPRTPECGQALKTYIMHELTCWCDYRSGEPLGHWRSTSGFEVDFVIGDHTAVEVKAKSNVGTADLKSLQKLEEEKAVRRLLCVCLEPCARRVGPVQVLPLSRFLAGLWDGEYS